MAQLSGKTALVTGASSGIGLATCVKLARMGADLVMVARDHAKGNVALEDVKRQSGSKAVSLLLCDFSSQAEIRKLAADYRSKHERLDILINNAGTVFPKRTVTRDGVEQTFAVNHLAYFLLTNLLLDVLENSAPSRVVSVSSSNHDQGDMEFDNLQYEKGGYLTRKAYARSKLANILFTFELGRRVAARGITANCLHPGVVATNLYSHAPWFMRPMLTVMKPFMLKPEQGADAVVHLATSPDLEGKTGGYYDRDKLADPLPLAQDEAVAKRLWEASERLVQAS